MNNIYDFKSIIGHLVSAEDGQPVSYQVNQEINKYIINNNSKLQEKHCKKGYFQLINQNILKIISSSFSSVDGLPLSDETIQRINVYISNISKINEQIKKKSY